MVSAATVGAMLAGRHRRVGLLLLALGPWLAANGVTYGYTNYRLLARRGRWVLLPFYAPYRSIPNPLAIPAALAGSGESSSMDAL